MPYLRVRRCCPGGCRRGNDPGRRCRAPRRRARWQGRHRRGRPPWRSLPSSPLQTQSSAYPRPACLPRQAPPFPALPPSEFPPLAFPLPVRFPLSRLPPVPTVFPLSALLPYSAFPPARRFLPPPGYPRPQPFPARYRSAQKRAAVFLRADPYLFSLSVMLSLPALYSWKLYHESKSMSIFLNAKAVAPKRDGFSGSARRAAAFFKREPNEVGLV